MKEIFTLLGLEYVRELAPGHKFLWHRRPDPKVGGYVDGKKILLNWDFIRLHETPKDAFLYILFHEITHTRTPDVHGKIFDKTFQALREEYGIPDRVSRLP